MLVVARAAGGAVLIQHRPSARKARVSLGFAGPVNAAQPRFPQNFRVHFPSFSFFKHILSAFFPQPAGLIADRKISTPARHNENKVIVTGCAEHKGRYRVLKVFLLFW